MRPLVDIETAKGHLNIIFDDGDADLMLKIRAASNIILRYLGENGLVYQQETDSDGEDTELLDDNGNPVVRYDVQAACLLLIGEMYRSREGTFPGTDPGSLPPAVVSLLSLVRDPVTA